MSITVVTMDGQATVTTGPAPVPSSPRVACQLPALDGWAIDPDGGPRHLFAHRRGDGWASVSIDVCPPGWEEEGAPTFIGITGLPYLHRDSEGWYFYADDRPRAYGAIRLTDEAACGLVAHALRRLGVGGA